jgi:hypothetical protein
MSRILLRVAAALGFIHGVLTFAAAGAMFHSLSADFLAFAQHGFAFVFLAGLNLVVWGPSTRSSAARYFVHGCNLVFLAFNAAFALQKPEPPNYVAVAILALLSIAGFSRDLARGR